MRSIIAVASGKGGVGKSTVAVNLALALARRPEKLKVALIDLDFYGPSIPTLMGGGTAAAAPDGKLLPAERHGIRYISLAFFLRQEDDAVIWRGPMFTKAIQQLFNEVDWGEIDYCVVDLPPGTGDAQLSLAQQVRLSAALIVTTPQKVAVMDVQRAINMFGKVSVPVLGVVENMAGFTAPDGSVHQIFGTGGGRTLAEKYGLPLLASLPLDPQVGIDGDEGTPTALREDCAVAQKFAALSEQVIEKLKAKKAAEPRLKVMN